MDAVSLEGPAGTVFPDDYPDGNALARVEGELTRMPPVLRREASEPAHGLLAVVAAGRAFLLQGGDCAESFKEFSDENIRNRWGLILGVAVVPALRLALSGA